MTTKKSKKDIAFDKERAAYRKQLRELEYEIKSLKVNQLNLKDQLQAAEAKQIETDEHIERLLEYVNLSKKDLDLIKKKDAAAESLINFFENTRILNRIGNFNL